MGNRVTIKKIGFEDVQHAIKQGRGNYLLISTLHLGDQGCLIQGTVSAHDEEALINKHEPGKLKTPWEVYKAKYM